MTNKFWRHMNIQSQGIEYIPVCDALFSNINRYIDYQHTFILSQYSLLFLRRYVNNIPSIFYEAVSELAQELVLETKICGFDSHQPHHMSHQHNEKCTRLRTVDNVWVRILDGTPINSHSVTVAQWFLMPLVLVRIQVGAPYSRVPEQLLGQSAKLLLSSWVQIPPRLPFYLIFS